MLLFGSAEIVVMYMSAKKLQRYVQLANIHSHSLKLELKIINFKFIKKNIRLLPLLFNVWQPLFLAVK
jgi:hypothetical protein